MRPRTPNLYCAGVDRLVGARSYGPVRSICFSVAMASVLLGARPGDAKEFVLLPGEDVNKVAAKIGQGDNIVLRNGVWTDADLRFERVNGSEDQPVVIRPESPGGVVFMGKTRFRISGRHLVVTGFTFRDCENVSDLFQFRTHSDRLAHNCRVTQCSFEETESFHNQIDSRWLSIYGTGNRVDHCYFAGKKNRGTTLVVWVADESGGHQIDHNHFGPRPELGRNGGETIRIGTSDVSEMDGEVLVESNYFHRCNGEAEVVSNKSCKNVYRNNYFERCSGALTLRHGHDCLVDGNVFVGEKTPGSGGVRIIGRDHRVENNYFEGLRGDSERAAICLMNGVPNGELNEYAGVRNALIAHNTFIDCKVSIEFGVGLSESQSANPTACAILNNVFMPGKWATFRVHGEPSEFEWRGNLHQPKRRDEGLLHEMDRVKLTYQRDPDGLLRPESTANMKIFGKPVVKSDFDQKPRGSLVIAGCDDPSTTKSIWPGPRNTGPNWRRRQP